jgi:N-acetyl-anhydromuramyl-L-alanine amidase AmpD
MVYDWASISEELGVLRWRTGEDAQTIARLEAANRELAEKVERIERKLINAKYGEGLEFNVRKILLEEFGGASLV